MDRVRAWNAATGSRGHSWSIVLDVAVDDPPDAELLERRLVGAWRPEFGPAPEVRPRMPGDLGRIADAPYREGRPLLRAAAGEGTVLLGAHHSALDGLGLVALLGAALDAPVTSSVRGLPAGQPVASTAGRAGDLFRTPAIAIPGSGVAGARGDHLAARTLSAGASIGTARLVAAAARAVRASGGSGGPVVIAAGASRRPGSEPTLEDASAFLRVRLEAGTEEEARAALRGAGAATGPGSPGRLAIAAGPLLGVAAWRVGATLLVSNLGLISGPGVRSAAFYPAAGGRSGLAIGVTGAGDVVTITLRAPRSRSSNDDVERLLAAVVRELESKRG
jgi:hypothetical protein